MRKEELNEILMRTVEDVFNTIVGLNVQLNEDVKLKNCNILSIMVIEMKENTGMFKISMDRETANNIAVHSTGIELEDLGEEIVNDTVAELLNMIAGSLKTRISQSERYFHLNPPHTITGDNIIFNTKEGTEELSMGFHLLDGSFVLDIIFN